MKSKVMTGRRKRDQLILVINIDRREQWRVRWWQGEGRGISWSWWLTFTEGRNEGRWSIWSGRSAFPERWKGPYFTPCYYHILYFKFWIWCKFASICCLVLKLVSIHRAPIFVMRGCPSWPYCMMLKKKLVYCMGVLYVQDIAWEETLACYRRATRETIMEVDGKGGGSPLLPFLSLKVSSYTEFLYKHVVSLWS